MQQRSKALRVSTRLAAARLLAFAICTLSVLCPLSISGAVAAQDPPQQLQAPAGPQPDQQTAPQSQPDESSAPPAQPDASAPQPDATAPAAAIAAQSDQSGMAAVLAQYGSFVQHPKYGEVWIPTVTPPGWHPYPPCHWVNTKEYGWYFDDRTPWGSIVHHYGRWTYDGQMGWIWIPGTEFSPGWVVWRTSPQWIGWAPMPPESDVRTISLQEFNNGGFWIFMETAKFDHGCGEGDIAPAAQIPSLVQQTQFVTQIDFVDGIAVFVLPPYVVGDVVVINVTFQPWPIWFLTQVVIDWNWVWTHLTVIINVVNKDCPPQ